MQLTLLSALALATGSLAQMMNLTSLLASQPELSNLTTYVTMYPQLVGTLGSAHNITILAPSNNAFSKLLSGPRGTAIQSASNQTIQDLLKYHVLQGMHPASAINSTPSFIPTLLTDPAETNVTGGQVIEAMAMNNHVYFVSAPMTNATVTKADLNFTGGVVHIIDEVLTVPMNISATALAANLTAIVGALNKANLTQAVDYMKDVTVFAPTNAAFEAIGSATGNLSIKQLTDILEYHVVNGTIAYSTDLKNGQKLKALDGKELIVTESNGNIYIDSAKVVLPNALVANGVVHVIDNVLNPNNTAATPNPSMTSQPPAFSGASSATIVPFTSLATAAPTGTATASGSASTSKAAAAPMRTGVMGAAAVVGAWVAFLNV